jgi:hypothetical protein
MRVVRNRRLCHAGYLWALPLNPNHRIPVAFTELALAI